MSAVLAVASLFVTLVRRPDDPSEDALRKDLRRQIDAMRIEVQRVRAQQSAAVRSSTVRHDAVAEAAGGREMGAIEGATSRAPAVLADEDEESRRARAEERAERRVALIDATLRGEGVDPAWADASARLIRDAAASPELVGSSVEAFECRSTICRVDVVHDSAQAADHFGGPFLTKLPDLPRGLVRRYPPDDDGRSRSVVFLAREGHRIPMLEDR